MYDRHPEFRFAVKTPSKTWRRLLCWTSRHN